MSREDTCDLDSGADIQKLVTTSRPVFINPPGRNIGLSEIDFDHSSHELNRPEAKRFRLKLTNLNIPKIDLVEVFVDLLEAENLKSKNLADEYPAFVSADVAAIVHRPEHKSMRINKLDRISRQQHRTWLIYAAWSRVV